VTVQADKYRVRAGVVWHNFVARERPRAVKNVHQRCGIAALKIVVGAAVRKDEGEFLTKSVQLSLLFAFVLFITERVRKDRVARASSFHEGLVLLFHVGEEDNTAAPEAANAEFKHGRNVGQELVIAENDDGP
jgi:hypothetical protein